MPQVAGRRQDNQLMKLAPGVHIEWVDQEAVILDQDKSLLHHLNPTAALVVAYIDEYGYTDGRRMIEERFAIENQGSEELEELLLKLIAQGLLVNDE